MNKEEFSRVFQSFEIDIDHAESIYKYAPVFKCKAGDATVILKRTKPDEDKARSLFSWTKDLQARNIEVVTPMKRKGKNPIQVDDDLWVMYPYIEGRKYNGSMEDIKRAGELLGRIHAVGENKKTLLSGFSWDIYDNDFRKEVKEDLLSIAKNYQGSVNAQAWRNLKRSIENLIQSDFAALKSVDLPMVDGCWDYKASNLIYDKGDRPVLIDPDNSGYIPRLFDLALGLILFHTENFAPGRVFTAAEWNIFKTGYLKYVELSDLEKTVWEDYLIFVFTDEALWAINDLEEDEPQRQKDFIKSLLEFEPRKYQL